MASPDHDVLIVGTGMTGRLAALALARRGFAVGLAGPREMAPDHRTTSLSYGSARAFRRLGLWEVLEPSACKVTDIVVSNATAPDRFRQGSASAPLWFSHELLPDRDRWDGAPLATMHRNVDLSRVLAEACAAEPGVTELPELYVTGHRDAGGQAVVTGRNGETAHASVVIACDGPRSRLRRGAGLRVIERDTKQDALTFLVGHTEPHRGTARQVFLRGGPLAALPLRGEVSSIVWSLPREMAGAMAALDEDDLAGRTRAALGPALGELSLLTTPERYPLRTAFAPRMTAPRLALAGDAAHALHPIAGQGFNLAVRDVAALADILADARATGLDIGHGTVLDGYDRWRRADVTALSVGTGALAAGLSTSERLTRLATGIGFGLIESAPALKARLARAAGTGAGPLPSLLAA